ncbi:MAG TPA: ElyC/SanA/YdcF family protein [Opitutaceae bacterium]|nr:ElyC/SanA/YdcF family protein [Opitutaceae bacterium]
MFFWLKKLLGYWIMPVPVLLLLLVAGWLLLRRPRRGRLGRALIATATILLLLLGNKFVSTWLVRPLETRYPAVPELVAGAPLPSAVAACRYVVVLGAGNGDSPGLSALDELSPSARARITEAVRLLRLLPDARLIVSGPADESPVTHATVLERAAISLGIAENRIQRIEHARDTEDESLAVKRRVGSAAFALVTSAWHMPRAMALFHAAGLNPLACPTDFSSHWDGRFHWRDFLWDVESLERSTYAVHERIGYAWIALRGKA